MPQLILYTAAALAIRNGFKRIRHSFRANRVPAPINTVQFPHPVTESAEAVDYINSCLLREYLESYRGLCHREKHVPKEVYEAFHARFDYLDELGL